MSWMFRRIRRAFRRAGHETEQRITRASADVTFRERKAAKLRLIRPLLDDRKPFRAGEMSYDFLTDGLRREFNIVDTENVSAHDYDGHALQIVRDIGDGLILDCGAGLRPVYLDRVVNLDICLYETTDVRGVAEVLPFRDGVFDCVFSFSVLEHVKDPFACAREIVRVLKPGGRLYCVVPFLAPFHAYPHHYYNMSGQGLRNLFGDLVVEKQEVNAGGLPIWALNWILSLWAEGLPPATRRRFMNLRVADLVRNPLELLREDFVTQLSERRNFDLATTSSLFARKVDSSSVASRN